MNYLYFAPNTDMTAFKMGFSITPDTRLDKIVGNINYQKTYLFACEDAQTTESFCHRYFKDFNVKLYEGDGSTEWFDISILKPAIKKVLRHQELLGIVSHGKFLDNFSPVSNTPCVPVNDLIIFDNEEMPSEDVNKIHWQNHSNLQYLVKHMPTFDWKVKGTNTYELRVMQKDFYLIDELLRHNKYRRDTGFGCGYFRIHYKSKRVYTRHLVVRWTQVNSKTIRRTSKSDLRLDCMAKMLDDLHTQMLDLTFII